MNVCSSTWTQELSLERSLEILKNLATYHASKTTSQQRERIETFIRKIEAGLEEADLELLNVDYEEIADADEITHARQAAALFEKLEVLPLNVNKEAIAFKKFLKAEDECRLTNEAFRMNARGSFCFSPDVESVLFTAQRKIARILGEVPPWEAFDFSFGPGANTSVPAYSANPHSKLGAVLACSPDMVQVAGALLAECPAWACAHNTHDPYHEVFLVDVEVHPGRLTFVPKNAKTYRSICIEPILNSVAQKGVGSYIRKRLRLAGLNLNTQFLNQEAARVASVDGNSATVDLSSASDTISKELVASLLPYEWFSLLSSFRTGKVEYKGDIITLEKFSSMGNAFTFELESLIFWALSQSVCERLHLPTSVLVYGDDIIIDVACLDLLRRVFMACGFTVNEGKTHSTGNFRESCGADWYLGTDIRPFYQKALVSGRTLFTLHNFYMRRFEFEAARMVVSMIHPSLLIYGPDGFGDGHLIGDWQPRLKVQMVKRGYEGATFDTFVLKSRKLKHARRSRGAYVLPSYSIYVQGDKAGTCDSTVVDHTVVRGSSGYKRLSVYTLRRGVFL